MGHRHIRSDIQRKGKPRKTAETGTSTHTEEPSGTPDPTTTSASTTDGPFGLSFWAGHRGSQMTSTLATTTRMVWPAHGHSQTAIPERSATSSTRHILYAPGPTSLNPDTPRPTFVPESRPNKGPEDKDSLPTMNKIVPVATVIILFTLVGALTWLRKSKTRRRQRTALPTERAPEETAAEGNAFQWIGRASSIFPSSRFSPARHFFTPKSNRRQCPPPPPPSLASPMQQITPASSINIPEPVIIGPMPVGYGLYGEYNQTGMDTSDMLSIDELENPFADCNNVQNPFADSNSLQDDEPPPPYWPQSVAPSYRSPTLTPRSSSVRSALASSMRNAPGSGNSSLRSGLGSGNSSLRNALVASMRMATPTLGNSSFPSALISSLRPTPRSDNSSLRSSLTSRLRNALTPFNSRTTEMAETPRESSPFSAGDNDGTSLLSGRTLLHNRNWDTLSAVSDVSMTQNPMAPRFGV